jgi:hypothetical protein
VIERPRRLRIRDLLLLVGVELVGDSLCLGRSVGILLGSRLDRLSRDCDVEWTGR